MGYIDGPMAWWYQESSHFSFSKSSKIWNQQAIAFPNSIYNMSYGYISYILYVCMYIIYIMIYLTVNAHRKRGTSIKIWVLSYDHENSHRLGVIGVIHRSWISLLIGARLLGCAHHAEDDAGHHGAALQQPVMRFRQDHPATLNGNCRIQLMEVR